MSRSNTFASSPARQKLLEHPRLKVVEDKVTGALSWFNPTRARFDILPKDHTDKSTYPEPGSHGGKIKPPVLPSGTQVEFRTRDNRKGRHALVLPFGYDAPEAPKVTKSWAGVRAGIWRMCTEWAWWDVSWWIAVLFSVGSALFLAAGFFYWLPLERPSSEFPGEAAVAGGVTCFIGATLFQIGALLLIVEAANENQTACFGWALEHTFSHESEGDSSSSNNGTETKATRECEHHHVHGLHKNSTIHLQHPDAGRKWEWWPTWHELRTHYFHEVGFLASFNLAIGSTIFYISGIMALPGVYNHLSQGVLYGVYWLAYLVGGIFFIISSVLYVFETQQRWYKPAPHLLGWWIGVWNTIGSVGWTVSAAFGYCTPSWCAYQSDLSLLWASLAFLIGSLLLWYESLDKYPVEREKKTK